MAAQPPRPKLPPLSALRAFEAAGRLGGFAPAAQELGVTPGAVTAHLKTLESALGVALFDRHHRGVALTDLGARVLPEFTEAFRALETAVHRLEAEAAPGLVRIATTGDLAQLWLSPRLAALRAQGLTVIPQPAAAPDAARGTADLALFPRPTAPPAGAQTSPPIGRNLAAPLIAVAAPSLPLGPDPATIAPAHTLILSGPLGNWTRWADAAGMPGFQPRGPVLSLAALAVEEAANGAGVLVIARPLVEQALGTGRLIDPFGIAAPSGQCLALWPLRPAGPDSAAARVLAALMGD